MKRATLMLALPTLCTCCTLYSVQVCWANSMDVVVAMRWNLLGHGSSSNRRKRVSLQVGQVCIGNFEEGDDCVPSSPPLSRLLVQPLSHLYYCLPVPKKIIWLLFCCISIRFCKYQCFCVILIEHCIQLDRFIAHSM